MNQSKKLITLALSLMLIVGYNESSSRPKKVYSISQFTAEYFNNGALVHTETVDSPSFNYAWSDYESIPASDFSATWEGEISVAGVKDKNIDINFDVSWSEVELLINGTLIDSWVNSSKTITHEFRRGKNKIKINYTNNWHTVGFNTTFSDSTRYNIESASPTIKSLVTPEDTIIYVGAYESGDLYNDINVSLSDGLGSVLIFLSSYESVNWNLQVPSSVNVKAIVYNSYDPESSVTPNINDIPAYLVDDLSYGYTDFTNPVSDVIALTGRAPDQTHGQYSLSTLDVTTN